jgi:hypothetical protein
MESIESMRAECVEETALRAVASKTAREPLTSAVYVTATTPAWIATVFRTAELHAIAAVSAVETEIL